MVVAAVRSFAGNSIGHKDEVLPSESGNALELVLNKLSAANPFSAAALASKGWTPRRLADLGQSQAIILTQEIAGLTVKSAALLIAQAKTAYEGLSKRGMHFLPMWRCYLTFCCLLLAREVNLTIYT